MAKQKLIVKKKKSGRGKAKGNSFQWEICKKLSLSVSDKDDIFQPTPSSGARGTRRKKTQETQATQHGDITYENIIGKPLIDIWSIEAKTGYGKTRKTKTGITKTNWCIIDIIEHNDNPTFLDFWLQTLEDAEASKREPVLIFRRNNKQPCIAFNSEYFYNEIEKYFSKFNSDYLEICVSNTNITILSFKTFLEWTNNRLVQFAESLI
jgi:hypothetical protein